MKKCMAFIMAVVMCFCTMISVLAEEGQNDENVIVEAEGVFGEALATKAKAENDTTVVVTKGDRPNPTPGDLLRYVPVTIEVGYDKVTVDGFFVNMNGDRTIVDFSEYEMDVYMKGDLLISGTFGSFDAWVPSYGVQSMTFVYHGKNNLNMGSYICDDRTYCVISCRFSSK